jgi:hypothetical protein
MTNACLALSSRPGTTCGSTSSQMWSRLPQYSLGSRRERSRHRWYRNLATVQNQLQDRRLPATHRRVEKARLLAHHDGLNGTRSVPFRYGPSSQASRQAWPTGPN